MLLSIIVPIYNTEKYLKECIDSILSQPIKDMEIICVNDGSNDGSLLILDELYKKDQRIKIIDKPNTGYGDTMNIGMSEATGEYIAFLESDDMLVSMALSKLITSAERNHAEIVKGNYYLWFSEENRFEYYDNMKAFQDGEMIKDKTALFFSAPSIWSAVYKKEFLRKHNLQFLSTPGASYQDTSFAFKVWAKAEQITTIKDPIVYYRQDNNQSSSNEEGKVFSICDEFHEIERFIMTNNLSNLGPIYAKVKYISYFWNVNRLGVSQKIEFLNGVFKELVSLKDHGWLCRELWQETEWNLINTCIYNFEAFKNRLLEGKDIWEASSFFDATE